MRADSGQGSAYVASRSNGHALAGIEIGDSLTHGERDLLQSCYEQSLRLASEAGLCTIAFPCISTGVYGYPKDEACEVAVGAVSAWLASHDLPRVVTFCCFDAADAARYRERLAR